MSPYILPETRFLQTTFATNPRNRVSLDNLCHQPTNLIETRFLFCLSQVARNRVSLDHLCHQPQKPGFFRPSLPPTNKSYRNPVSSWFLFCRSQITQKPNPRNRVSPDNLCHQPTNLIETRFLFGFFFAEVNSLETGFIDFKNANYRL